jgi:hypothetical protein
MRRVLLIGLLFLCCCKNKDTTTTPTGAVDEKFSFSAQYDSVLSVYPNSDYNFSFYIRVNSGNISKNILTCSISGLPAGVTVTPVSQEVGVLLGGVFTFKVANVAVGNYPIKFEINGKQGSEMHNLILQVKPLPDYAQALAGTYAGCFDYCLPGTTTNYTSVVTAVADTPYLLKISNLKNLGTSFVVRGWTSDVVIIPQQTVDGRIVWGRGTFSKDGRPGHGADYVINIKDTIVAGTDTNTCTVNILH